MYPKQIVLLGGGSSEDMHLKLYLYIITLYIWFSSVLILALALKQRFKSNIQQ